MEHPKPVTIPIRPEIPLFDEIYAQIRAKQIKIPSSGQDVSDSHKYDHKTSENKLSNR